MLALKAAHCGIGRGARDWTCVKTEGPLLAEKNNAYILHNQAWFLYSFCGELAVSILNISKNLTVTM